MNQSPSPSYNIFNIKLNTTPEFIKKYSPYLYELYKSTLYEKGNLNDIQVSIQSLDIPDLNNTINLLNEWVKERQKDDNIEKLIGYSVSYETYLLKLQPINKLFNLLYLSDFLSIDHLIDILIETIFKKFIEISIYHDEYIIYFNIKEAKITDLCYKKLKEYIINEPIYNEPIYNKLYKNRILEQMDYAINNKSIYSERLYDIYKKSSSKI
jgi:hypothetical protein